MPSAPWSRACAHCGAGDLRHTRHAHRPPGGRLRGAGLDYYNHNLDTSPEHYGDIITTRTYQDRLDTLEHVRDAGIKICCGGIVGMGEDAADRAGLIAALASLPKAPESVPINALVRVVGTPLADAPPIDAIDFVRVVAAAPSPCQPLRAPVGGARGDDG